jgi:hypothetical protein
MKAKIIIIIIGQLVFLTSTAQKITQTVRGKVSDVETNIPLPGATVIIENSDPLIGTVTDLDGNFRFDNVPVGRQTIKATFMGYQPWMVSNIEVSSAKEVVLDIKLEEMVQKIKGVEIVAGNKKGSIQSNGNSKCPIRIDGGG